MKKNLMLLFLCVLSQILCGPLAMASDMSDSGDNPEQPENEVLDCFVARLEQAGTLDDVLGGKLMYIDSLVVEGPLNDIDFNTMWQATFYGSTTVINLENAVCGNLLPPNAFYNQKVQNVNNHITPIKLRRIILNEGIGVIGSYAFSHATRLEKVNIPTTLHYINDGAFNDCINLAIPELLIPWATEVGNASFQWCEKIEKAVFHNALKIGGYSFYGAGLKSIEIYGGVSDISHYAFARCQLTEVDFSEVSKLSGAAILAGNQQLKKITLNNELEEIPYELASNCRQLEECNIPSKCRIIKDWAFNLCMNLKNVEFPEGLASIGEQAFIECKSMTVLDFPSTLKEIGLRGFEGCAGVALIYSRAITPPACSVGAFDGVSVDVPLLVPKGTAELYRTAPQWSRFHNILETAYFPSGVDEIASDADGSTVITGGLGSVNIVSSIAEYCEVYGTDGRLVVDSPLVDGGVTIELPAGMYIIKAGTTVAKVLVR